MVTIKQRCEGRRDGGGSRPRKDGNFSISIDVDPPSLGASPTYFSSMLSSSAQALSSTWPPLEVCRRLWLTTLLITCASLPASTSTAGLTEAAYDDDEDDSADDAGYDDGGDDGWA